ncbi:hypothetical protein HYH03_007074 [Edaphochlamys debaryana]|uniref:Uncharacterized protein n=1 Tax=Edaphochlamys debaryana TaxID=47281 RepID=A0A835Y442_9CHLO|nr:hypothetical protein HYH03_007074 [Edaphochlamys debaryana]|eukprot:KAG2494834.1 hypothetical protein HYH03_007074 [Edaphochlamys debaryana]
MATVHISSVVRGVVKEACRAVDRADDAGTLWAASAIHAALVAGDPGLAQRWNAAAIPPTCNAGHGIQRQQPEPTPGGPAHPSPAPQPIQLYLQQLQDARSAGAEAAEAVDAEARLALFWGYWEPWAAALLTAVPSTSSSLSPRGPASSPGTAAPADAPNRTLLLLRALLQLTPAPVLLRGLASHLSLVAPADGDLGGGGPVRGSRARVAARGAEVAAAALAQRFAAAGCTGVAELLLYLSVRPYGTGGAGALCGLEAGDGADEGGPEAGFGLRHLGAPLAVQDEQTLRRWLLLPEASGPAGCSYDTYGSLYGSIGSCDAASLAALLASLPDRAAGLLAGGASRPLGSHQGRSQGVDSRGGAQEGEESDGCEASLPGPERFAWAVLRQLWAAMRDPGATVAATLARLRDRWRRRRDGLTEPTGLQPPLTAPLEPSGEGSGAGGPDSGRSAEEARRDMEGEAKEEVSPAGSAALASRVAAAAAALAAEVLERLIRRGQVVAAADAVLSCTPSLAAAYGTAASAATVIESDGSGRARLREGLTAALLQLAEASPTAMERLLTALLDRCAAAAAATAAAAGSAAPPDAKGHQLESLLGLPLPLSPPALDAAVTALRWLLPPPLLARAAVGPALSDALLALRRPPLPLPSLHLLTAALPALDPTAQPAAATSAAAAAWADADAVTKTSPQRQAALSAALLLLLLPHFDRPSLESVPGLLGSILSGVSARLGSPLVASQRQAMRVGRGFSMVLDGPGSDLFGDMGDLGLGPEELWPGALPAAAVVAWRPAWAEPAAPAVGALEAAAAGDGGSRIAAHVRSGKGEDGGQEEGGSEGGDGDADSIHTTTDSDDEDAEGVEEVEVEDDGLKPLGTVEEMEGDAAADVWRRAEPGALQLRALAAALRKADDAAAVLAALGKLEELIRAAPDELGLAAPELVRALLHCRVPEWAAEEAEAEAGGGGAGFGQQRQRQQRQQKGRGGGAGGARPLPNTAAPNAAEQRRRCLVALLAVAPLPAGDALVPEVYSPHLDMHQRITLLDSLAAAAAELADPRLAPRLTLQGTTPGGPSGLAPRLERPFAAAGGRSRPALTGAGGPSSSGASRVEAEAEGAGRRGPKTRVWAPAALRKRREEAEAEAAGLPPPGSRTFRNRFADVALRWAAGLLREVDVVKHGVDLLGRDAPLLGRLLGTLAAFAEAAAGSGALPPLAGATLELLRAEQVHKHPEPYVRRAALLAAGQVLAQLPPPSVAAALLGAAAGGGGGAGAGGGGGGASGGGALAERLEWVAGWSRGVAEGDVDPHCRMMAQAVVNLQADLASRSLAYLQEAAAAAPALAPSLPSLDLAATARMLSSGGLGGGGGGGGMGGGLRGLSAVAAVASLVDDLSAP